MTILAQDVVENMICTIVQNEAVVSKERLAALIEQFAVPAGWSTEKQKAVLQMRLEERLSIQITLGAVIQEQYEPWLAAKQASITPFFWERYRQFLLGDGFAPTVVARLNDVSDRILGLLQDPTKAGSWYRRGLVVGHVQSGKTANYLGLINKSADAGYQLIILIAGTLNNLRRQTQERVDDGFVGRDSSKILRATKTNHPVGVGLRDPSRFPVVFTSTEKDFHLATAQSLGLSLRAVKEPVILVIKKNKQTLENLADWLKRLNAGGADVISDVPMLLIDDEADNASINTAGSGTDPNTINRLIRQLLNLFSKRCYVGYTATPFANIFIDPDTNSSMLGDDLFPRDFIYSLDPPSNYFGPDVIFADPPTVEATRTIDDFDQFLPLKHKKDARPAQLPESLKEAVRCFCLVRAIRLARGQHAKHNSMLVNVSRFTGVQTHVRDLIDEYLGHIKRAAQFNYKLPWPRASADPMMAALRHTWEDEYRMTCEWSDLQDHLHEALAPISVVEVNMRTGASALNYKLNKEHGLNVIAVGGLSLSRGFTLEGLSISYVLRNSQMYDTLLQMGRWFGYRDGYADLCRIAMPEDALGWYAHITEAISELRAELRRMESVGLTPAEFGLKVRAHPDSLIVTARNKMRKAETVYWDVELAGQLIESSKIHANLDRIENNLKALESLVQDLEKFVSAVASGSNHLWTAAPRRLVCDFIKRFQNHPASLKTETQAVFQYCSSEDNAELSLWDVVLVNKQDGELRDVAGKRVGMQSRTTKRENLNPPAFFISGKKARVAGRGLEKTGLSVVEVGRAEQRYADDNPDGKNIADHYYRAERSRPLLMLHVLQLKEQGDIAAAAYGISFPGSHPGRPKVLVKYEVNPIWWREQYGYDLEEIDEVQADADT